MVSITSTFQPCFSAKREYIRNKSPAKIADSSPPAPALISIITSRSSFGSRGSNNSSSLSAAEFLVTSSAANSDANVGSASASSLPALKSSSADLYARYPAITGPSAAYLLPNALALF